MSNTRTRTKNRNLELPNAGVEAVRQGQLNELAVRFYLLNKASNATKLEAEKTRKKLYLLMKEHKLTHLDLSYVNEEKVTMPLEAKIVTPTGQAVDVAKLQKLVTKDQFLSIVEASQKAVTDIVGTATLAQCLVPTTGTENVSVKVAK